MTNNRVVTWGRETAIRMLMDHRRDTRPEDSEAAHHQYQEMLRAKTDRDLERHVRTLLFRNHFTVVMISPGSLPTHDPDVAGMWADVPRKVFPVCPKARPS